MKFIKPQAYLEQLEAHGLESQEPLLQDFKHEQLERVNIPAPAINRTNVFITPKDFTHLSLVK